MVNFSVASSNCLPQNSGEFSRHTPSLTPSRRVCRNLFGTVNHDEIREELRKENMKTLEEKKIEYNFDFEKEEPLPGRYVWEKVSTPERTNNCNNLATEDGVISRNISSSILLKTERSKNSSSKDKKEHKITDYFRAKKRKYDEEKDLRRNTHAKIRHTANLETRCTCSSTCKC